jgi:D-alanyl-D-alanine carboxypeptidase
MSRTAWLSGLLALTAAIAVAVGSWLPTSSSATAASPLDDVPTVANLDPGLRDALARAATDAADDGVELVVESGWRSPGHQQQLFEDAVAEHGSVDEAARWVASPTTSAHVSGDAADIGPSAATGWLAEHGAAYGLCQIYGNEPWHYELRPDAVEHGCPSGYADPTHDPRMQQ